MYYFVFKSSGEASREDPDTQLYQLAYQLIHPVNPMTHE